MPTESAAKIASPSEGADGEISRAVTRFREDLGRVRAAIARRLVGQNEIVDGVLKHRAKRGGPEGHRELFECIYVGLYDHTTEPGSVVFFNVADEPPSVGRPTARKGLEVGTRVDPLRDLEGMLKEIVAVYDARNP